MSRCVDHSRISSFAAAGSVNAALRANRPVRSRQPEILHNLRRRTGFVQSVEVQPWHTGPQQFLALLRGVFNAKLRGGGVIVAKSFQVREQPPRNSLAPHSAVNRLICAVLCMGMMPGTMGTVTPSLLRWSRNSKKSALSKKSCVMTKSAPQSILFFNRCQSTSLPSLQATSAFGKSRRANGKAAELLEISDKLKRELETALGFF